MGVYKKIYNKMNYEQFKEINKKVSGFLSNERYAAEKYPEFFKSVSEYGNSLAGMNFKEKLYRYFKGDTEEKICVCGSPRKLLSIEKGHQEFCSAACANKHTVGRIKKVKEEKYGDSSYNNSSKSKETISRRTDSDRGEILEKRRKTKLEKYGDPNYTNTKKAAESRRKANSENKNSQIQLYDVEILECLEDRSYRIKCKKCGEESHVLNSRFNVRLRKGHDPCIKCRS